MSTASRLGPRKHTRAPSPVRGKRILRQEKRILRQKRRVLMIEFLSSPLARRIPGVPAATGRDRLPPGHPQRCHPLLPAHEPALRARFDGAHLEPGLRALGRDHDHRPGPLGSPGGGSAPGVAQFRIRASRFAIDIVRFGGSEWTGGEGVLEFTCGRPVLPLTTSPADGSLRTEARTPEFITARPDLPLTASPAPGSLRAGTRAPEFTCARPVLPLTGRRRAAR